MQPYATSFFAILKRFFVKAEIGRKPIEEVSCLGSNTTSTNEKSVGFRKLDPPDRLKNVRSVILGVVGIQPSWVWWKSCEKRAWSLVIRLDQLQVLVFASLTFKTGLELLKL